MGSAWNQTLAMGFFLIPVAILSTVPFILGLLGFSKRAPAVWALLVVVVLGYRDVVNFSDFLKQQDIYSALLDRLWLNAQSFVALLIFFIISHWFGVKIRDGFSWIASKFTALSTTVKVPTKNDDP